jgi:hypothetical protein
VPVDVVEVDDETIAELAEIETIEAEPLLLAGPAENNRAPVVEIDADLVEADAAPVEHTTVEMVRDVEPVEADATLVEAPAQVTTPFDRVIRQWGRRR